MCTNFNPLSGIHRKNESKNILLSIIFSICSYCNGMCNLYEHFIKTDHLHVCVLDPISAY